MRVRRLELRAVRGVAERHVELLPAGADRGVVVVEGPNEAGKSSLGDALDALVRYKATSTDRFVRSLGTAGADVGPEVVAELVLGDHHLTYGKRFGRSAGTWLEVHAPRREKLSGDDAHERVLALLEAHVDRALLDALRRRQDDPVRLPDVEGSSRLVSALRAAGDGAPAGERERRISDAARAERDRYVTPTGRTAKAVADEERAVAELAERAGAARRAVADLDADVERAERLESARPGLVAALAEERAGAARLAEARRGVDQLDDRRAHAEAAMAAAGAALDAAVERRDRRAGTASELDALRRDHREATETVRRLAGEVDRLGVELADLDRDRGAARARLDEARRRHDDAASALARARDAREHAALDARLERLADAERRRVDAEAAVASNPVDDALIGEVRRADAELRAAEAALTGASPTLRVTATRVVKVDLDGEVVELDPGEGRDLPVVAPVSVVLDDAATVEVDPGPGTGALRERTDAARGALRALLDRAGVDEVAAAERRHRHRVEVERDLAAARAAGAAAAGDDGVDALRRRLDVLTARLTASDHAAGRLPVPAASPDDAALEAAEAEVVAAEAALDPARRELVELDDAVAGRREERAEHQRRLAAAEADAASLAARVDAVARELEHARADTPDDALAAAVDDAEADRGAAVAALAEAEAELAAARPDLVRERADNAAAVVTDLERRLAAHDEELHTTRGRIEAVGGRGLFEHAAELEAELERRRADLDGLRGRAAAAVRLVEALDRHRAELHRRWAAPLRHTVERYGAHLHGPGFAVELDEHLAVTRRVLDGEALDVAALSVGAREQLALLTRLACATLVGADGGLVWLDDDLVNTDPERLVALGPVLRAAGERCQVVLLTCDPDRYRHVGGAHRVRLD